MSNYNKNTTGMIVQTLTSAGRTNANGYIYTKETIEKAIENSKERIENGDIKLTTQSFDRYSTKRDMMTVDPEFVIGDITKIEDGLITVNVYNDKLDLFIRLMNNGYKPGMRYTANSENTKDTIIDDFHPYVTDINIIAFDMTNIINSINLSNIMLSSIKKEYKKGNISMRELISKEKFSHLLDVERRILLSWAGELELKK